MKYIIAISELLAIDYVSRHDPKKYKIWFTDRVFGNFVAIEADEILVV